MTAFASTIVGIATGTPDGGVAIVRLSGPRAREIGGALAGSLPPARQLTRRRLSGGEDALVVWMPGPRSFTGEDVVELHVHGGARNVREVVDEVLRAGAVAAGPGEFSRRAFETGRLSLDQAEGIAALIAAKTHAGVEQARRLIAGELGQEIEAVRLGVGALRAEIEAHLDFPEDVPAEDRRRWGEELADLEREVGSWLRRFDSGRRSRERARVVLTGPVNAGKSSLFNALLGRSRALVSPAPGTTRDYLEAEMSLGEHEIVLVDTAGLREVADPVERAGVERSREQSQGADLVVWVEAADAEPTGEESGDLRVENKRDRGHRRDWLGVSAVTGEGLEALRDALSRGLSGDDAPWIGLARHRERASEAHQALVEAGGELLEGPLEVIAFQLSVAERSLAEITGRHVMGPVGAEVLERIFSQFCIGK